MDHWTKIAVSCLTARQQFFPSDSGNDMLNLGLLKAIFVWVCLCLPEWGNGGIFFITLLTKTGAPEPVQPCRGPGLFIIKVLYLYVFQFHAKSVVVQKQLFVSTLTLLQLGLQFSLIVSTHLLKLLQLRLSLISPDDNTMFAFKDNSHVYSSLTHGYHLSCLLEDLCGVGCS